MPFLSGYKRVVQRALALVVFQLFRLVFTVFQRLFWELNGTAQKLREANDPRNYGSSAQVLDIVTWQKFCELQTTTFKEFLCTHNRFVSPQYILDNDNITLLLIEEDRAIFCEAKEKDMHLWKSKFNPFIRLAQLDYAAKLIVMPMTSFHRLADSIGDPKAEIVFIFNTGRCGSTLLTQIMEYTGRCVSLSEPDSPNLVAAKYGKCGDTPEMRQLARSVIRVECRPYNCFDPPPLAYAMKVTAPSTAAIPLFRELFPRSRCLFMYRDIVRTSKSLYRVSYQWPSLWLAYALGSMSAALTEKVVDGIGYDGKNFRMRLENGLSLGTLLNIVAMNAYLDMRRKGFEVAAVRYEDLVGRPLESCRRIIEYCGLPVSLAEKGVKGLETDSQANTKLARTALGSYPEPELTAEAKHSMNEMLGKYPGLPLIGQECLIDGTITYDK